MKFTTEFDTCVFDASDFVASVPTNTVGGDSQITTMDAVHPGLQDACD